MGEEVDLSLQTGERGINLQELGVDPAQVCRYDGGGQKGYQVVKRQSLK